MEFLECAEEGRSGEATKHSSGNARAGTREQKSSEMKLEAVHKQSVACSHHNSQTPEYALGELKKREN